MNSCNKSTRLRFTYEDDLVLLREFLNVNPIINLQGWEIIQSNVAITTGKNYLIKTLKQHVQRLIELFLNKIKVDEIRSGIEEPPCEKNMLLQEVSSLVQEHKYDFRKKRSTSSSSSKDHMIMEMGKKAREACAQTFGEIEEGLVEEEVINEVPTPMAVDEHCYFIHEEAPQEEIIVEEITEPTVPPTPSTSKESKPTPASRKKILGQTRKKEPLRKNALLYLQEKNERENNIKIKELELEERKILIEQEKLSLKREEMRLREKELELHHKEVMAKLEAEKNRGDLDIAERKLSIQLMQSQQKLIDQLLHKE
ncbi:nucleoporin GLE1-like [Sitophilus oryzae]|uniref:Nucleoporin GLE1-like n=1 Tax=Sitophilus oryzae TaxID=7048 RepID=A0A6J2YT72_SITOR|nr:nucleoporin GLE1-like [Sitophilus oryzae]